MSLILVDDIYRIAKAVEIGPDTVQIALQSIWLGIVVSVALMIIAAFGVIPATAGAPFSKNSSTSQPSSPHYVRSEADATHGTRRVRSIDPGHSRALARRPRSGGDHLLHPQL